METIRIMVKSILVIIILAAFLEIVLPRNDMKRYINLIIGLFVIVSMLNPFLNIINKGFSLDILDRAIEEKNSETEELIQKGLKLSHDHKMAVAENFKDKLSKQVMAIAGTYRDNQITEVEVEMYDDPSNEKFGQVKKIFLKVSNEEQAHNSDDTGAVVEDINIDQIEIDRPDSQNNQNYTAPSKTDNKIKELKKIISDFYGLNPEQVEIKN